MERIVVIMSYLVSRVCVEVSFRDLRNILDDGVADRTVVADHEAQQAYLKQNARCVSKKFLNYHIGSS